MKTCLLHGCPDCLTGPARFLHGGGEHGSGTACSKRLCRAGHRHKLLCAIHLTAARAAAPLRKPLRRLAAGQALAERGILESHLVLTIVKPCHMKGLSQISGNIRAARSSFVIHVQFCCAGGWTVQPRARRSMREALLDTKWLVCASAHARLCWTCPHAKHPS